MAIRLGLFKPETMIPQYGRLCAVSMVLVSIADLDLQSGALDNPFQSTTTFSGLVPLQSIGMHLRTVRRTHADGPSQQS
jgi:hypothetical protein